MKKFNFNIVFLCGNTNRLKSTIKEYSAMDYIQAKSGMIDYCNTNETFKEVYGLYCVKFGAISNNLLID